MPQSNTGAGLERIEMEQESGGRSRYMPSPSMAVALLALFVAMGGSAWAVAKVGTNQLKNNAVTTSKIKPSAVNGSRIANGAVTSSKIADGAVTGAKIADGAVGGGKVDIAAVLGDPVSIPTGTSEIASATCPEGKSALSAGFQANTGAVIIYQQYVSGNSAYVYAASPSGSEVPLEVTAQVVCV